MFRLKKHLVKEMVEHARREAPNECCGLLAGKDGQAMRVYPAANAEKSPVRYSLDPKELYSCLKEIEEQGWELLGIYHSHTHSPAYPSATDIRLAFWPDARYLIISLQDSSRPQVRAFFIREKSVEEEPVEEELGGRAWLT